MTYMQTLIYLLQDKGTAYIGPYSVTTSIRNSFGSVSRRVGNCILDEKTKEVQISPKMDWIAEQVRKELEHPGKGIYPFPWVISSQYLNRGALGSQRRVLQKAKEQKWKKLPRCIELHGGTKDREAVRLSCVNGEKDLLFQGKVCDKGVDLPNFSTIILLEELDNPGKKTQTIGRITRAANKTSRKKVQALSTISTFPDRPPTKEEEKAVTDHFMWYYKTTPEEMHDRGMKSVIEEIDKIIKGRKTADQIRVERNVRKMKEIEPIKSILKAASIRANDSYEIYQEEYQRLLK